MYRLFWHLNASFSNRGGLNRRSCLGLFFKNTYFLISIISGPYYRFRTFQDLYETPYSKYAHCDQAMWNRLSRVPIYVILFLISGYLFPLKAVLNDDYYQTSSFIYRIFYMTPVFFNFRMRLYSGFILSECSCIMAGLGAYPKKSGKDLCQVSTRVTLKIKEEKFHQIHKVQ